MLIIFQDNLGKFYARQRRRQQRKRRGERGKGCGFLRLLNGKKVWLCYFALFRVLGAMRSVITLLCVNIIIFKCNFFTWRILHFNRRAVLCANFFTEINQVSGGWLMLSFQPFYVRYIHHVMETFIAFWISLVF